MSRLDAREAWPRKRGHGTRPIRLKRALARLVLSVLLLLPAGSTSAEFVRPKSASDPLVYGVKGGILLAVHPHGIDPRRNGGPRGLLRIGHEEGGKRCLFNFIAVEPIVGAARGFSELERSADGRRGKTFRLSDTRQSDAPPEGSRAPGQVVSTEHGPALTLFVHVEPFLNGARPVVEATFFEKWPRRVRFRTFSAAGGRPMSQCVLTATMGNQSRCRVLWLDDRSPYAPDLYAEYNGNGFVQHDLYGLKDLHKTALGDVVAVLSPDEIEPSEVWPFPSGLWRQAGPWVAQYWLKPRGSFDGSLRCRVNGRQVYWMSFRSLPGGIAFENFDLPERFEEGRESWFGYTTESPKDLFGFAYDASPERDAKRTVPAEEQSQRAEAARRGETLTNGDFRRGLEGWRVEGGAAGFRVVQQGDRTVLATRGAGGAAVQGRLYQCFTVPTDASELRGLLQGGCDRKRLYVALWRGDRLWRRMTASNDDTPLEFRWDVRPLRGEVVTLEIRDQADGPWGYLGVSGLAVVRDGDEGALTLPTGPVAR